MPFPKAAALGHPAGRQERARPDGSRRPRGRRLWSPQPISGRGLSALEGGGPAASPAWTGPGICRWGSPAHSAPGGTAREPGVGERRCSSVGPAGLGGWRSLQSRLSGRWDRRAARLRRAACKAVLCKEGARPGVPVIHSCLPLRGFICLGSANSALLGAGACQHDPSRRGSLLWSVPSVPPLAHHNLTFSSPRSSLQCPSCPRPRSTAWAGPESHLLTCSPE